MSLTITSFPERAVNNNPAFLSKWSAVHHEMIFGMHRQDFQVQVLESGSNIKVNLQGFIGNISDELSINDEVYIETPTGSATFVVTSVVDPNTFTALKGTFTGFGFGYANFLNRTNYFILTNIFGVDSSNTYFLIGTSVNSPDNTGRATVDVSSFLKSAVDYIDEFDYITLNQKDLTLGGAYNINFSENWTGFIGVFSGMSSTILRFYANAAKQIQDILGENMGEFVPFFIDQSPILVEQGKFLSDFDEPTYFPGFPFSLSFIYSESLAGIKTFRHQDNFNINGGASTSPSPAQLNNSQIQEVNRLSVDTSFDPDADNAEVWLETDGEIDCIKYVASGYVASGYVEEICGLPVIELPPELGF